MPTPVITNTQLGWATMSTVQSNILPVTSFFKGLYFRKPAQNLTTESVELSYLEGHKKMAPFVEVNAEAINVDGNSTVFANVSCPNIRIKRPMEAYNVLIRRQPGTGIFQNSPGVVTSARNSAISEDAETMARMIERREEWMAAKFLTGVDASNLILNYQVSEKANFTVTIPRPANHVASPVTAWASSTKIELDFHNAKKRMAKSQLVPTHCILDDLAAADFMVNSGVRATLDTKNVTAGDLQLANQFSEAGAIYLGRFCGISVWHYTGEYIDEDGVTVTPYMPTNKAIFLNASPANGAEWFYGAIPDHDAFEQGMFVGKRFSKATKTFDPSIYTQLVHTRPLPMIRKPGSIYVLSTN